MIPSMKRRGAATSLAAILLVGLTGAVGAESLTVAGAVVEAPPASSGWKVTPVKGGAMFQRDFSAAENEDEKGGALIQIIVSDDTSPTAFDQGFKALVGAFPDLAEEDPTTESSGTTLNGYRIRTDHRCCEHRDSISIAATSVGLASDHRQAFLMLAALELNGDARDRAEADFAALVRSVRLSPDDSAPEMKPGEGDGGLDGAYTYLDTGVMPNAFGGIDFYSESEITLFDPSGLYATELPKGTDLAAYCTATPTDCGFYKLTGGGLFGGARQIEMREIADEFGTVEAETQAFARKGEGIVIGERDYFAVPPVETGTTFDGTWRYFFASAGSMAGSSGSIAVERFLELRPDGTFSRSGWSGGSSTSDMGGGTTGVTVGSDRPSDTGRYAVDGYAMTLTGDDGRAETLSLFAPEKGSDELLVIDGQNYLKQEGEGSSASKTPRRPSRPTVTSTAAEPTEPKKPAPRSDP